MTARDAGADASDSDPDAITGKPGTYTLAAYQSDLTVDPDAAAWLTFAQRDEGRCRAQAAQAEAGRRRLQQLIELRDNDYGAEFRFSVNAMTFSPATLRQLATSGARLPTLSPALGMTKPATPVH